MRSISLTLLLLFSVQQKIISFKIQDLQLPICNNSTFKLGYNSTQFFFNQLFSTKNILSYEEMNCIMNTPTKMSTIINSCISQLTINDNTTPAKVCEGLALDNNENWVSACAPDMPCVEFNTLLINGNFSELIQYCNIESKFKNLLIDTNLIEYSILGYEECQLYDPDICVYPEKNQSDFTYYACAVSRWIFISNFILIYFINPELAINMPGCRIIYN